MTDGSHTEGGCDTPVTFESQPLCSPPANVAATPTLSAMAALAAPERGAKRPSKKWLLAKLVAPLFWLYLLTKVFLFDWDTQLLLHVAPNWVWLVNLRFIGILVLFAFLFLFFRGRSWIGCLLYILFFPIVVLFYYIPKLLIHFRSWTLAIAVFSALLSFFASLKRLVIFSAVLLLAIAVNVNTTSKLLLITTTAVLLCILIAAYIDRFFVIFRPSVVMKVHTTAFEWLRGIGRSIHRQEKHQEVLSLPTSALTEEQRGQRTTLLQVAVIVSRFHIAGANKLKDYQLSNAGVIASALSVVLVALLTVLVFAIANFSLFRISPEAYAAIPSASLFDFFYSSFATLFVSSVPDIRPLSNMAKALEMGQWLCSLGIIIIFVSLVVTAKHQRVSAELAEMIETIRAEGERYERAMLRDFKYASIEEALQELQSVKAAFVQFIYRLVRSADA